MQQMLTPILVFLLKLNNINKLSIGNGCLQCNKNFTIRGGGHLFNTVKENHRGRGSDLQFSKCDLFDTWLACLEKPA
jgi:hypothetical protein